MIDRILGRHFLLMSGEQSCAYIPKRTYKMLNDLMFDALAKDAKAENSLRFIWAKTDEGYMLAVNPDGVEMTCTHGLTMDDKKHIIIPCPYIQQVYHHLGKEPEYCGRVYLKRVAMPKTSKTLAVYNLVSKD